MGLFTLIPVLLIEQIRPLPYRLLVHNNLSALADSLERKLNAGEHRHGVLAWTVAVGGAVSAAGGMHVLLHSFSPLLAWIWNVLVLYLAMGYGQFSQDYSEIQMALRMDDPVEARRLLAGCIERSCDGLSASEVARRAIEAALVSAHRHFFGVLFCFILLPGPCGAVLYRMATFLADAWGRKNDAEAADFGDFSRRAFAIIDWLPARLTATAFAVVGNFEDAIYGWRAKSSLRSGHSGDAGIGVVLASAGGALGVRLGDGTHAQDDDSVETGDNGTIGETDADSMQGATALIWRAVVLCLLLLLLFGFARLVAV